MEWPGEATERPTQRSMELLDWELGHCEGLQRGVGEIMSFLILRKSLSSREFAFSNSFTFLHILSIYMLFTCIS